MANPEAEKTIINVKGVYVSAWEDAKRSAAKTGESMGMWLSLAIRDRANLLAGERLIPPGNPEPQPGNPPQSGSEPVAALLQGIAAMAAATGVMPSTSVIRRIYNAADSLLPGSAVPPRRVLLERNDRGRFLPRMDGKEPGKEVNLGR